MDFNPQTRISQLELRKSGYVTGPFNQASKRGSGDREIQFIFLKRLGNKPGCNYHFGTSIIFGLSTEKGNSWGWLDFCKIADTFHYTYSPVSKA